MKTIKKDYTAVMSLFAQAITTLEENKVKKSVLESVRSLYNDAVDLTANKNSNGSGSKTTAYYREGKLVAVFCYYHKHWELVDHIEYGNKAGTKTGLNTMCKEGVSAWTKANRAYNKLKDDLLQKLFKKEITNEELQDALSVESTIEPHSDEDHSFATIELLEAYLDAQDTTEE
jgi:hypothetical protein